LFESTGVFTVPAGYAGGGIYGNDAHLSVLSKLPVWVGDIFPLRSLVCPEACAG
jgi:hypothetical protein